MTSQDLYALPPAWEAIFGRRAAPGQAAAMIADARRYLGLNSPERVADLRTVDTLRNLVHAYVEDADREAALLEIFFRFRTALTFKFLSVSACGKVAVMSYFCTCHVIEARLSS